MTKIAIISDSHDNIWSLDKALEQVRASGADMLLHCGDLVAPFIIDRLANGFPGQIHIVFGNNDGDGRLLQTLAANHPRVHLHGIYIELETGGRRIAMIHYPEPARRIAQSGQFDLVCYGHDHTKHAELIGDAWLVNPGEIMGMRGHATWGLYDCDAHTFEHITISEIG
jgi:putative phosphoesterase